MIRILAILLLSCNFAVAQISQQTITNDITNNLPTNNIQEISAQLLRNTLNAMTSAIFQSQGLNGLTITGTPSIGQVPVATSSSTASWQTIGAVSTIVNNDGSLIFSPTFGNVIGSINTAHSNTFTVNQNFSTLSAISSSDLTSISCNPPTFGGGWICQNSITSSSNTTHSDFRATLNIFRTASGSGGGLGGVSDAAEFISAQKTNYLSSSILGDIQVNFTTGAQGLNGDIGGIQSVVSKVYGSVTGTGGAVAMQNAALWIDTSGNTLMNINTSMSLAEGIGGLTSHTGYGFISESWGPTVSVAASQVTPYTSYYGGAFDVNSNCPTHCPTFTNFLTAAGSRTASHVFFNISQGLNESGKVSLGSGAANGLDGNPTRSGGTRISFENVSGSLLFTNDGGSSIANLNQSGSLSIGGIVGTGALNIHAATNQNIAVFSGVNSGAVLSGANDAYNAIAPLSLNGNPLYLQVNASNALTMTTTTATFAGTLGIPQVTWADNQTCTVGQISVDASFIYVCTASNTVKRAALSSF